MEWARVAGNQRPQGAEWEAGNFRRPAPGAGRGVVAAAGLVHAGAGTVDWRRERSVPKHVGGSVAGSPGASGVFGQSAISSTLPRAATIEAALNRAGQRNRLVRGFDELG